MKILPLSADSLGARSMATWIETEEVKILIDPGVALAPLRFNLPPHKIELERKEAQLNLIKEKSEESEIVIVTHYHYDHHLPDELAIYQNKILLIKDPTNNINESQRQRAEYFLKNIASIVKELKIADGKEFIFNDIRLKFSPPVKHGKSERLGYVIEVLIEKDKEKFIFTSDVQGIVEKEHLNFILENNPSFLYADGPMTYMLNYRYKEEDLINSIENIKQIIKETEVKTIILDHHLTRDKNYKNFIKELFLQDKAKVLTSAQYLGKEDELFEARRQELYKQNSYPSSGTQLL